MSYGNVSWRPTSNYNYNQGGMGNNYRQNANTAQNDSIFNKANTNYSATNNASSAYQAPPTPPPVDPQQSYNVIQQLMKTIADLTKQKNETTQTASNSSNNTVNNTVKDLDKGLKPWKW